MPWRWGPEPVDTNKWADIYRGLGDTWAGVAGWPTRGQGPDQERLIKVRGFVIPGCRGRQLTTARFAGLWSTHSEDRGLFDTDERWPSSC